MKVKIIEQFKDEGSLLLEERINDFLSEDISIVHIRIMTGKDYLLKAIIIYRRGNS